MAFKLLNHPAVPPALRGPVLVDNRLVPRYWATVWSIMSGAQLAPATLTKKLRYIETLYVHADQLRGNGALDRALASLDEITLAEVLESWFVSIRNQPELTDADEVRWQTGLSFITSTLTWLSRSTVPNGRLKRIEERLHRPMLMTLTQCFHSSAHADHAPLVDGSAAFLTILRARWAAVSPRRSQPAEQMAGARLVRMQRA